MSSLFQDATPPGGAAATGALARKWRPRELSALTGQEHVVRALSSALDQGRLHHAWLFTGTRGVGKTTLARILAKALNCERGVSASPCGACEACRQIDAGRFVDLIELDAASNTQVDRMRELLEGAMYAPTAGRYKVYIIDEVHMLSRSAFNAMLKTLEEPPEHVKFILATTDPDKVPVTVLSRCLQFALKNIPPAQIVSRLEHVLRAEGIGFDAAALRLIARAAQGSLRDALSLTDQAIAAGAGEVREEPSRAMLGVVGRDHLFDLLERVAAADGPGLIAAIDALAERGVGFEAALREMAVMLHRAAVIQVVPAALDDDDPEAVQWQSLARVFSPEDIQLDYQIAIQALDELSLAPDEHTGFTMAMLRMLAFAPASAAASGVNAPAASTGSGTTAPSATPSAAMPETGTSRVEAARAAIASGRLPTPTPAGSQAARPAAPLGPARAALAAAQAAAEKKKLTADGWAAFILQAGVTGMARMLAQHCELASHETGARGDRIELVLGDAHRHLLEKPYQDKLQQGLSAALGTPVELRVRTGAPVAETPIEQEQRAQSERQRAAVESIERDPFVRDLINTFDARLDTDAIRPSGETAGRDAPPRTVASSGHPPSSPPTASESP